MDYEYKAFISYSHRDSRWAEWLLHALETYRLPDSKVRGVGRVFRDRDEAGAGDLREEIQRALAASENLIVIASPNSARSVYVQAEIDAFVAHHAARDVRGHIVTLIVDGEPNVSGDGPADPRECFPPALRGGIALIDGSTFEPLAADARAVGDGRTRALAKLIAGLMDIRYDTLVRRDLMRRRRTRILVGMAALAALLIAGGIAAVLVAGNLEQERLRVASDNAAREARTVSAVNDAERARRLFESGNSADAIELARQSLPLDGSVPFIPQAYDVLYRSVYDRTQKVQADLAGYHQAVPVVLAAGPGHYLVYNDSGTATIWSVDRGIVYRRSDLYWEKRPSLAPDGSVILLTGSDAMLRLSLPDRLWSSIDLSGALPDFSSPDYAVAIDAASFYACREKRLLRIGIDDELRGNIIWHVDLPVPCNGMTLTPSGGVAIALGSFAYEFDGNGVGVRMVGPAGDVASERIYATGDAIILSSASGTSVYRGYDNLPVVIEGRGMEYDSLSPDGRWFTYTDGDRGGLVIVDLASGEERLLPCLCVFVGYAGNKQILTNWDRTVEAFALETLETLGVVHIFEAGAESFAYLEAENLLMALRRSGPESIAFLDEQGSRTMLVDGSGDFRRSILDAAFTGTHSVLTRELGPDGITFNIIDASAVPQGADTARTTLMIPTRSGVAYPLADRSFAVVDLQDGLGGWTVDIFDGETGERRWEALSESDPGVRAGDRFVGAQSETGVTVLDAATGTATPVAGTDFVSWRIGGDMLIGAREEEGAFQLDAIRLGDGPPSPAWSQSLDTLPYAICIAPVSGIIHMIGWSGDAAWLERRSGTDGAVLTSLETSDTSLLRDGQMRPVFDISCDTTSLRLSDGLTQQWRWDSAANVLAVEAKAATPPRTARDAGGTSGDGMIEDGVIGWDDEGSWLYDPSGNRVVTGFASAGGRVSANVWLSPLGLAVLGFESGRLEVWDARHPSAAMMGLNAHTSPVIAIDYDPVRGQILSADQEGTIHLWPVRDPAALAAEVEVGATR